MLAVERPISHRENRPISVTQVCASAAVGGSVESIVANPFLVYKVRLQVVPNQPPDFASRVRPLLGPECMRGLSLNTQSNVLRRMWAFGFNQFVQNKTRDHAFLGAHQTAVSFSAGVISGVCETVFNPLRGPATLQQAGTHAAQTRGALQTLAYVYRQEGVAAFTRGLGISAWRNGVAGGAYFGVLHGMNTLLVAPPGNHGGRDALVGATAGISTVLISHPLDTLRSRVQSQVDVKQSAWALAKQMRREEGLMAFTKGVWPNALRCVFSAATGYFVMGKIDPWVRTHVS